MCKINTLPPETIEIIPDNARLCLIDPALKAHISSALQSRDARRFQIIDHVPNPDESIRAVCVLLVSDSVSSANSGDYYTWIAGRRPRDTKVITLCSDPIDDCFRSDLLPGFLFLTLPDDSNPKLIIDAIDRAFDSLLLQDQNATLRAKLQLSYEEIGKLTEVGQALATEHDFDRLLTLMLDHAKTLVSADSGTIYVAERNHASGRATALRFKKTSLSVAADEYLLPINAASIAGYVAYSKKPLVINDVYALTGKEKFKFNRSFDIQHNYTTRSVMAIPMMDYRNEVIGVVQLINRTEVDQYDDTPSNIQVDGVYPFTRKCLELASALVGQAAVVIQNNRLLEDINNLFEGFVKASVTAIEQRDPVTAGHSFRVADYTTRLAQAVSDSKLEPFANIHFTGDQLRELRYASLLHDFGKVGVSEQILTKAKKLYHPELEIIKWRFRYQRKILEKEALHAKMNFLKKNGTDGFLDYEVNVNGNLEQKIQELEDTLRGIENSNDPISGAFLTEDELRAFTTRMVNIDNGIEVPLLRENEFLSLSVVNGNLNSDERREIETHAALTYKFLGQIPWITGLIGVPDIAYHHHEKLDGSGYPLGLKANAISIQTRMMTIADIFDALTAADRPYKKAATAEEALNILRLEEKDGHLDSDLLNLFIDKRIYESAT